MNDLVTIQNVKGYVDENGIAFLNLEDVARGLGFTEIAASGNECIKWSRVRGYLKDLKFIDTSVDGSPEVGKEQFIHENIFYRLAMKAKNETAEKFQALIADEILPVIRKTGSYGLTLQRPKTPLEILSVAVAELTRQNENLIQQDKRLSYLEAKVSGIENTLVGADPSFFLAPKVT
jgi:prophage antirepressor-like protein